MNSTTLLLPLGHISNNAPLVNYEIMGHPYNKVYYLVGGIYPPLPVFVKTCRDRKEEKYTRFAKMTGGLPEGCGASIWCVAVSFGLCSAPC
jgi:hypothetical protein